MCPQQLEIACSGGLSWQRFWDSWLNGAAHFHFDLKLVHYTIGFVSLRALQTGLRPDRLVILAMGRHRQRTCHHEVNPLICTSYPGSGAQDKNGLFFGLLCMHSMFGILNQSESASVVRAPRLRDTGALFGPDMDSTTCGASTLAPATAAVDVLAVAGFAPLLPCPSPSQLSIPSSFKYTSINSVVDLRFNIGIGKGGGAGLGLGTLLTVVVALVFALPLPASVITVVPMGTLPLLVC